MSRALIDLQNIEAIKSSKRVKKFNTELTKSEFIQELPVPTEPMSWTTKNKKGSIHHIHSNTNLGYVEVDGIPTHPLKLIAGQVRGYLGDVPNFNIPKERTKGRIDEDDAFMSPFLSDRFTLVATGQHHRNGNDNKEHSELMVINYPYEYITYINPVDNLIEIAENIYITPRQDLRVFVEVDSQYMPHEIVENIDGFLKAKDSLIQMNKMFYFKGDLAPMTVSEVTDILKTRLNYHIYIDDGKHKTISEHITTTLQKWLKENVIEVSKVEHYYSYLNTSSEPRATLHGKTYRIIGRLQDPIKPDFDKPADYNEIIEWLETNKLPELHQLLMISIASGFEVQWEGSKKYLAVIKAVSDWAKTALYAKALVNAGMATQFGTTEFAGLAGIGGARLSGANPVEIGQYPITIFDEASTPDKKMDMAVADKLKEFTVGMPLRTLNTGNVNIRGHIALILSRVSVSAFDNAHDEYLNRMVKLRIAKNEAYNYNKAIQDVNKALTWYIYKTSNKLIIDFEAMTVQERIKWCNENISFEYDEIRKQDKQDAEEYPYSVLLDFVKTGAMQILDNSKCNSTPFDSPYSYDKGHPVVAGTNGRIAFTSQSGIYNFLGGSLHEGTKNDIKDLLVRAGGSHLNQRSYKKLINHESAKAWVVIQLDFYELLNPKPSKIDNMSYAEILTAITQTLPNEKAWSRIARRVIMLEEEIKPVEDLQNSTKEEFSWDY